MWALLLVLIWQVTGTALGALLAHIVSNFIATIGHTTAFNPYAWDVVYTWFSVAGLILMIVLIPQAVRTLKCLRSTSTPPDPCRRMPTHRRQFRHPHRTEAHTMTTIPHRRRPRMVTINPPPGAPPATEPPSNSGTCAA